MGRRVFGAALMVVAVVPLVGEEVTQAATPRPEVGCVAVPSSCNGDLTVTVVNDDGGSFSTGYTYMKLGGSMGMGPLTDFMPSDTIEGALEPLSTYVVLIDVPGHLYPVSSSCVGPVDSVVQQTLTFLQFRYTDDAGGPVTCTFHIGNKVPVQIVKNSHLGAGSFDFELTDGTTVTSAKLTTSGNPATGSVTVYVAPGIYDLTEIDKPGWIEDSLECVDQNGASLGHVDMVLMPKGSYTCTADNTLGVFFEITKSWSMPEEEQPEFATFYWDGASGDTFQVPTGVTYAGTLLPGEHQLTEVAEGFDVELHCDKFDVVGNYLGTFEGVGSAVDVEAVAGDRLICFATNEPLVRLHISKRVNVDVDSAPIFEFSAAGRSVEVVAQRPSDPIADLQTLWVPAGQVVIEESGPVGWGLAAVLCSQPGGGPAVTILDNDTFRLDVEAGAEVTCTVDNFRDLSISKTVTQFEPADNPGEYLVSWEVSVHNPFEYDFASPTLTDQLSLPPGVEILDIEAVGPYLWEEWNGGSTDLLTAGLQLGAGQTTTWTINALVSMAPNLPPELLECADFGGTGGLGNTARVVSPADVVDSSESVCTDLPAADLAVDKDPVGGPTDNGDGTWTQVYSVTVSNSGDGYVTYDLIDEPGFAPIFEIVSGWYGSGDNLPVAVDPWTGPVPLALDVPIGAGETHTYSVGIDFTIPDPDELDTDPADIGWFCEVDREPVSGNGLYNVAYLMVGGESVADAVIERPAITDATCHDGPSPNVVVDKEVVGYTYDGPGTIAVEFDVTVSNLATEESGDVLSSGVALVDVPALSPVFEGITPVYIELTGAEGAEEGVDYSVDFGEMMPDVPTMLLETMVAADTTQVFRVLVVYEVDVEVGWNGTCWDGTLDGSTPEPGGTANFVIWRDEFHGVDFYFPYGPVDARQRLQQIIDLPPEFDMGGIGFAYDCVDIGGIWISKDVVNDNGGDAEGGDFLFDVKHADGDIERTIEAGQPYIVVAGQYEIVEQPVAGYEPGVFECSGFDFLETEGLDEQVMVPFAERVGSGRVQGEDPTPGVAHLDIEGSWGWACDITNDDVAADLSVSKGDGGATAVAGGAPITYTFEVRNTGGFLDGDVTLRDELPEGWSWVPGSVTGCVSSTITGQLLECVISESTLELQGSSAIVTAQARVAADAESGEYVNMAWIDSVSDPMPEVPVCPPPALATEVGEAPDVVCETTPVVRQASMTATKVSSASGPVAVGGTVVFTLSVRNDGPSSLLAGTTLVDDLPAGLNFVSVSAPGWTCGVGDPVACEYGLPLAPGASAPPIQITTTIAVGASGTITNTGVFTGIVDMQLVDGLAQAQVVEVTAVASAAASVQVAAAGGRIPDTGAGSGVWLQWSLLLMGVGAAVLVVSRRRRVAPDA